MQSSTNGCCAQASPRADRLAGVVLIGERPKIDPEANERVPTRYDSCDAGFFRLHPGEVLDLVHLGKSIEICPDLARDADPVAVLMPWAQYKELISMRDRAAAIFGGMQPQTQRAG